MDPKDPGGGSVEAVIRRRKNRSRIHRKALHNRRKKATMVLTVNEQKKSGIRGNLCLEGKKNNRSMKS